tara:strand:+ start:436 stop:804 length:369 start_codon:yes stop_codon:yes gene_type:complete
MKRIFLFLLLIFLTTSYSSGAEVNFTKDTFEKAQKDGKTVVINSWNKYCGTCIRQEKVFKEARNDFQNVLFLTFEQSNKKIANLLNIDYRSTIVVYKNNKEVARAIGIINKDKIYSLINTGI